MNTADSFIIQFQQRVLNTIRTYRLAAEGESVLAGVSGGPDSVCLLHVLHSLKETLHIKLYAIHINHMLRGEEAKADENYTSDLCKKLGVPFSIVNADVALIAKQQGKSLEEAGREARYREFDRFSKQVGATKIAVAHNRNDQAETIMMHIIRGTGTAGLVGMEHIRGNIIRPLLDIQRSEIERYCTEAGLNPRTDSTNLKADFTRNKVRLGLFPYMSEQFGVNIIDSLIRLSENAAEDNSYLDACARAAYERAVVNRETGSMELSLTKLKEMDPAVRNRVMKLAVVHTAGSSNGVGSVHYRMLSDLITGGSTGSAAELPNGIRAALSYNILRVFTERLKAEKKEPSLSFSQPLALPGITEVPELGAKVSAEVISADNIDNCETLGYNPLVQYFDYDRINGVINIRNRQSGDIFKPLKSNGTKKIKEYFIDIKVPRDERDRIPLICKGNEAVWVVGYKISDKFKVTENTKSILKLEYSRRN